MNGAVRGANRESVAKTQKTKLGVSNVNSEQFQSCE